MQTQPKKFRGQIDCLRHVYDHCGVRGVYKGVCLTYCRDVPSFCTWFMVYEILKAKARGYFFGCLVRIKQFMTPAFQLLFLGHFQATLLAGACAGMAGWGVAIPLDTVKNRHQAVLEPGRSWQTLRSLHAAEGVRGFYRGAVPILARAPPANAANFLGYEMALKFMAARYPADDS